MSLKNKREPFSIQHLSKHFSTIQEYSKVTTFRARPTPLLDYMNPLDTRCSLVHTQYGPNRNILSYHCGDMRVQTYSRLAAQAIMYGRTTKQGIQAGFICLAHEVRRIYDTLQNRTTRRTDRADPKHSETTRTGPRMAVSWRQPFP
jgi:hypothetical protein